MNALAFDPNRLLKGASVPPWLAEFARAPGAALDELLAGRAYLGHLSPLQPLELLGGWLRAFAADAAFTGALDRALIDWIETHWGEYLLGGSARLAADAWTQVADLLAVAAPPGAEDDDRRLTGAAAVLRRRLLADRRFLNGLGEGRGRDPAASAWRAIARHQQDRDLLPEWWRLCRLPADEPWYRGAIGIEGLAGLPPENRGLSGRFDKQVAEGLARLGEAFQRRATEGWLEEATAREEFQFTLQQTLRAYPFDDRWQGFWRYALTGRGETPLALWVKELLPGLRIPESPEPGGNWARPDPDWSKKAEAIASELRRAKDGSVDKAKKLLEEQRKYADQSREVEFFMRSSTYFARSVRDWQPQQALAWARTAREYDPSNGHAWTTETECLRALQRDAEALAHATATARRFPNDPVAQSTLAEVLRATGDLEQALVLYREVTKRFPSHEPARNGLRAVERELRQGRSNHPRTPPTPAAPTTEQPLDGDTIALLTADAYLLRRWARHAGRFATHLPPSAWRERARTLLERFAALLGQSPQAVEAYALLRAAQPDFDTAGLDDTFALLEEAAKRFPGSARVRYALARAERALGRGTDLPWRRLARLDPRLEPVRLLGSGRGLLEQDAAKARDALGRLAYWCSRHGGEAPTGGDDEQDFIRWWCGQIQATLFDGTAAVNADTLPDPQTLRTRLAEQAGALDDLEEELVDHHAWS